MLRHEIVAPRDGEPRALHVMVLHGLGDSMAGWKPVVAEVDLPGVGWVFVDAPNPYYDGRSWFPIPGITAPDDTVDDARAGIGDSRARLAELIEHLGADADLEPARLLLLGFSQGGVVALDQGLRAATPFAGIVAISGFVGAEEEYPDAFGPAVGRQHILATHGRFDDLIPIERPREQYRRLRELGVDVDWQEYDKDHSLHPAELLRIRDFIGGRLKAEG